MDDARVSYPELARLFLRLSVAAFGGPVAHIAMVEDEVVTRRRWLTREHFLDMLAATNLIPGPNSTEMMIHIGFTMRGIPGAVLTGACFIIPSFLITLALAVLYVAGGSVPQVDAALSGITPVILAVILVAGYRLVPTALKTPALWLIFALALLAVGPLAAPEVLVIVGAGVLHALYELARAGGALFGARRWSAVRRGALAGAAGSRSGRAGRARRAARLVLVFFQDRLGLVRQRLRAHHLHPARPRQQLWLAD